MPTSGERNAPNPIESTYAHTHMMKIVNTNEFSTTKTTQMNPNKRALSTHYQIKCVFEDAFIFHFLFEGKTTISSRKSNRITGICLKKNLAAHYPRFIPSLVHPREHKKD